MDSSLVSESACELKVGLQRVTITPPVGIPMVGFAGRGPSTAIDDPLHCTAVLFAVEGHSAALVSCDLLGMDDAMTDAVAAQTAAAGLELDDLVLHATHTHYGPATGLPAHGDVLPLVSRYRETLVDIIAGAVVAASRNLQPAALSTAASSCDIGVNRRERTPDNRIVLGQAPDKPCDRHVQVVRIDSPTGSPLATLVNFQCHPVSRGGSCRLLSADFPGVMCDVMEQFTGAPAVYLQGACGNINPVRIGIGIPLTPGRRSLEALGLRLAASVLQVWERTAPDAGPLEPVPSGGLSCQQAACDLPRMVHGSAAEAAALRDSLQEEVNRLASAGSPGALEWAQRRLASAVTACDYWERGIVPEPVKARVHAWRIGGMTLATVPGELFNEIGARLRHASGAQAPLVLAYTDGSVGYLPTRESYAEGGYEVTHACRVDPAGPEMLESTLTELLDRSRKIRL